MDNMDKDTRVNPTRGASNPGFDEEQTTSHEHNEEIGRFLDSAQRAMDRVDIREAFYTDPTSEVARHHLADGDIKAHHRASDFPHMRPQMSLYKVPHKDSKKKKKHHRHHSLREVSPEVDDQLAHVGSLESVDGGPTSLPASPHHAEESATDISRPSEAVTEKIEDKPQMDFLNRLTDNTSSAPFIQLGDETEPALSLPLDESDTDIQYSLPSGTEDYVPSSVSKTTDPTALGGSQETERESAVLPSDQSGKAADDSASEDSKPLPSKLSFLQQIGVDTPHTPLFSMSSSNVAPEVPEEFTDVVPGTTSKVTFLLGDVDEEEGDTQKEKEKDAEADLIKTESKDSIKDSPEKQRHHKHKHHHHMRIPSQKELALRRHLGSEVTLEIEQKLTEIHKDEDDILNEDEDAMARHRYEGNQGVSRRRISTQHGAVSSVIHIQGKKKKVPTATLR